MSELKRCPFCGGEAFYIKIMGNYEKPHEIFCSKCDGAITEGRSEKQVVTNWNTRPIEDELTARIAELREDNASLGDSNAWLKQNYEDLERDYGVMYDKMCARIAALKRVIEILEDRQREVKNILIDKNLYIDSLYEEGFKLKQRIAELEAERRWRIIADGEFPEDRATVLVAFTEYPEQIDILTATYYKHYKGFGGVDNWWDIEGWHSGEVTHWMPLPEPPIVYGKECEE